MGTELKKRPLDRLECTGGQAFCLLPEYSDLLEPVETDSSQPEPIQVPNFEIAGTIGQQDSFLSEMDRRIAIPTIQVALD